MALHRDDLVLFGGKEFEGELSPATAALTPHEIESYKTIVEWTRNFLCRSHELLGREGPVCPFTQPSLNQNLFWLSIIPGSEIDMEATGDAVVRFRDWFFELTPQSGPEALLKTILIIFPDVSHETAKVQLEALQKKLKPDFVKKAIMVGQFYQGCPESGLWNDSFHPLQSPIPLLAIRNMVPSDFPFLHGKRGNSDMLIAYLNKFGTHIPPDVKRLMVEALETSELTLTAKKPKPVAS
jgi:hypothetical protein